MDDVGPSLPSGLELVRTTREFDETTVPSGLLREHRVADGVWGRLVVRAGSLRFLFDGDDAGTGRTIEAPGVQVIPPAVPHHVVVDGPVRFVVEFHEAPAADTVTA